MQSEAGGAGSTTESSSNGVWQGEAHYIFTIFTSDNKLLLQFRKLHHHTQEFPRWFFSVNRYCLVLE